MTDKDDWLQSILSTLYHSYNGADGDLYYTSDAKKAILAHLQAEKIAARIDAYADCASKGGTGKEVREYAKSRGYALMQEQLKAERGKYV